MAYSSLDSLTKKVEQLLKLLGAVDKVAKGINTTGGGTGTGNLSGALGTVSAVAPKWAAVGSVLQGAATMAGGISTMMPSVDLVMAREAALYGAGVNSGGMMRRDTMNRMSMNNLGQYQNIANAGAVTSAIISGMGIAPNSAQFTRVQTSAGQAARYLNMSNDVAAQAFGGFGSGSTSAGLMRRFGIFTSNPGTGESMSQQAIFEQMYNRFTGGQQVGLKDTMDSLYKGYLGAAIKNSGLDSAQQEIIKSQFIGKAMGMNIDYSDPNSVAAAEKKLNDMGYENVFQQGMKVTAADDRTASYATDTYVASVKAASDALVFFKDNAVPGLIDAFGGLKAYLDTFMGDRIGQGMAAVTGGMGAAVMGLGLNGMLGGGGGKGGAAPKGYTVGKDGNLYYGKGSGKSGRVDAKTAKKIRAKAKAGGAGKLGGKLGAIGATLGVLSDIPGNIEATNAGYGGSAWGNTIGTAAGSVLGGMAGGALGSFLGPAGTVVGSFLGSMAGGWLGGMAGEAIGGMFDVGGPSTAFSSGTSDTSGAGFSRPVSGGNITAPYGQQRDYGVHKGTDIGVPEGTPVYAVADGKVIAAQSGSGDRSYGLYVEVKHSKRYSTLYAHLSRIDVRVGQMITQGTRLGLSGQTGYATGPHLHFEVRRDGNAISPNGLMKEDLTSEGSVYSVSNNAGKGAKRPKSGANILDLATNPAAAGAASSIVSTSMSGVSGFSQSTSQVIGSGIRGGVQALSAPVLAVTSGSMSDTGSSQKAGTGGGDVYTPVASTYGSNYGGLVEKETAAKKITKNNVTINLTIAKASDGEARKFAKLVKEYIDDEKFTENMGSR